MPGAAMLEVSSASLEILSYATGGCGLARESFDCMKPGLRRPSKSTPFPGTHGVAASGRNPNKSLRSRRRLRHCGVSRLTALVRRYEAVRTRSEHGRRGLSQRREHLVVVLGRFDLSEHARDHAVRTDHERRALVAEVRFAVHRLLDPYAVGVRDAVALVGQQGEVQALLLVEPLDLRHGIRRDA